MSKYPHRYKKAHLLYVPFTGLGKIDRGDKWLKDRIKIFKHFITNSLADQSSLQYTLWFSWRPEDKKNPIVQDFLIHMEAFDRLSIVFTYDGLCFWDDKYEDQEAGERLLNNLRRSLRYIKTHVDYADEVLMTIQPSDDMYLYSMVEDMAKVDFRKTTHQSPFPDYYKVAGYTKGYIANYQTMEIAEYNPDTIPPFFTIRFPVDVFLDWKEHFKYAHYKSHEYVKDLGFKELKGRGFVVGVHGQNIGTSWSIPYKGRILSKEEADKVWLLTGNHFTEPLKLRVAPRLLLRKVYNILPFKKFLKKVYNYVQ